MQNDSIVLMENTLSINRTRNATFLGKYHLLQPGGGGGGSWNWIEIHKTELPPKTDVTKIVVPPFKKEEISCPFSLRLHFTTLISVHLI